MSRDLGSLLAGQKTANGFYLVPSAFAATYMLTVHFSCSIVSKQTNFAPCLSIIVLDTMSFQTVLRSSLLYLKEGIYLIENLRACKIYRVRLSINRSGSCCAVFVLRCSKKPLRHMKLLTHSLLFHLITVVKISLGYDKFPEDTQSIGSPIVNLLN